MSLKVAIVGAGWMGETHAHAVSASGDEVALVIDSDIRWAKRLAAQYGAEAATELSAAKDLDAAIIATPSVLHLQQSEYLAELGLAVLVEKPHRFPNERADRLLQIVAETARPFQIGMTTRFHPGLQAIAGAVRDGQLGEILSYSDRYWFRLEDDTLPGWYFDPVRAGGGVLLTNGVHILDRCRWILGTGLEVQHARLARLFAHHEVEDFAAISGRTDGGHTAVHLSLLWTPVDPRPSELVIVGTKGMAHSGPDDWTIETPEAKNGGKAPAPDEPFAAQWRDFRAKCLGQSEMMLDDPTLGMLEMTLQDIENIYAMESA